MSIWDDPEVKAASTQSGYVKFDAIGDAVSGNIAAVSKHTWSDGSVAVKIDFSEDDVPTLTASQVLLKSALYELKPAVGDTLSITLVAVENKGGKTLKKFRIAHTPQGKSDPVVIDQS